MQCHDCPNQTDGKCCHQSIRTQGSKTMNLLDDRANDEADRHSQMMQSQRKPKQTVTTVTADTSRSPMNYYPSVWGSIKTGTEYEK